MIKAVKESPFVEVERLKPIGRGWETDSTSNTIIECGLPKLETGQTTVSLDATELRLLLDGIDFTHLRRPRLWEPHQVSPG
jgi:hypothetical protein